MYLQSLEPVRGSTLAQTAIVLRSWYRWIRPSTVPTLTNVQIAIIYIAGLTCLQAELGGKVLPKLNWSSPKDATWISPTNDMECRTPNEIYLLLKSSDFITHDLEHAFDGCIDSLPIPYHLALRKSFNLNPSVEFRVFVRHEQVIAISQREMNHFPFLHDMRNAFRRLIQDSVPDFPDLNFVFDVYIPPPHNKVWIVDINPWAPRTDPLLFSWLELLTMPEAMEDTIFEPEFRLVGRDDPEAYQFAATKYSAHKLPVDVVDAGLTPERMKDMLEEWRKAQDGELGSDVESEEETSG